MIIQSINGELISAYNSVARQSDASVPCRDRGEQRDRRMPMNSFVDIRHPERIYETEPMPAWTYLSAELLELEYERVILPSWQFVCHQNQVREAGDFATLDLMRDSIIVMRGRDGALRAFQNACRHRGSKLLDGEGTCKHRITCPYHAWSYQLDGRLAGVPSEKTFPGLDKSQLGLKELELEVFCGLVFVRIIGG